MVQLKSKRRWHVLEGLINANGWTRGVELGVFKGDTFLYLLWKCPELHLTGVDTWTPQPEQDKRRNEGGRSYAQYDLDAFHERVVRRSQGFGNRARIIRSTTLKAPEMVGDVDFVFIDADHTYEGVRADIDAWLPKIRRGGMILGHDFNSRDFPGVVKAVTERCESPELFQDHVWGWRV